MPNGRLLRVPHAQCHGLALERLAPRQIDGRGLMEAATVVADARRRGDVVEECNAPTDPRSW
jgi:hypothetical protein